MSSIAELCTPPQWSVQPMSPEQASLVVSWLAALNSEHTINQGELIAKMEREVAEGTASGTLEYFLGYYRQLPTFFMTGLLCRGVLSVVGPGLAGSADYEVVTLLVSPLIPQELRFFVFRMAIQSLFERELVSRVLFQLEVTDRMDKSILMRLGFTAIVDHRTTAEFDWYACRREGFLTAAPFASGGQ